MISVILVQHNNGRLTLDAIESLRRHHTCVYEVIVVDNASTDGSASLVRNERVTLMESRNKGFGAANNLAALRADGEILFFLNNDTLCTSEYLPAVEKAFGEDGGMGALGPRLNFPDGTFQLSAGRLPTFWREIGEKYLYAAERKNVRAVRKRAEASYARRMDVGWVTGAALFIRRDLFHELGGFNEKMFMYFEDKDLCARVWESGSRVVFDPSFSMIHLKGGSSPGGMTDRLKREYRKSQIRYYAAHRPTLERSLLRAYLGLTGRKPNA